MALLKANTGIGITNPSSALHVIGDGLFVGIVSATTFYGNLGDGVQGSVPYQSGINSTTFLSPGSPGQVLVTGGSGQNPYWSPAASLSGSFSGITIKDEGTLVGSALSVSSLNFVGNNISATASGPNATITLSNDAQYLTGTAPGNVISQSNGLDITGNLNISGNLSVGGTSIILNAATLQIKDRDIVLGITTNALNQDISTDLTATHGGIAIASTEGSPLINFPIELGINNNPSTYKQLMWIKAGTYSGMGTDAWVSNYALSIGNTSTVANGSRLTVGSGFTVYDNLVYAPNIYSTGIITATQFVGSVTGNVTTATYAAAAGIATYATNAGIATYATNAGIATYATNSGIATYATNSGIATYATNAGIATNLKSGSAGNVPYQSATDATTFITNGNPGQVLLFNGSVPVWGDIGGASGAFGGITILDEGTIVGSASSVSSLNFVGANIVATALGAAATITIASNLVGTALSISGISTFGTVQVSSGIITATTGIVTYYGDGSKLSNIISGVSISTNTTNQSQYLIYTTGTGSTTGFGITTAGLVFNPSTGNLGIGTTNPTSRLSIVGDGLFTGVVTATTFIGTATTATNVVGGIGSVSSLRVTGFSTLSNISVASSIFDSTNSSGVSQYVLTSTSTGILWQSVTGAGAIAGINVATSSVNSSFNIGLFNINSGTTSNAFVAPSDLTYNPSRTFVGIGTTNPTSKLTISGALRSQALGIGSEFIVSDTGSFVPSVSIAATIGSGTTEKVLLRSISRNQGTLDVVSNYRQNQMMNVSDTNSEGVFRVTALETSTVAFVAPIYRQLLVVGESGIVTTRNAVAIATVNATGAGGVVGADIYGNVNIRSPFSTSTSYVAIAPNFRDNGALSFEAPIGAASTNSVTQLFSITNNVSSSIFRINDLSRNPILEANVAGNIGIGTTSPQRKLEVQGITRITSVGSTANEQIDIRHYRNTAYQRLGISTDNRGALGFDGGNAYSGYTGNLFTLVNDNSGTLVSVHRYNSFPGIATAFNIDFSGAINATENLKVRGNVDFSNGSVSIARSEKFTFDVFRLSGVTTFRDGITAVGSTYVSVNAVGGGRGGQLLTITNDNDAYSFLVNRNVGVNSLTPVATGNAIITPSLSVDKYGEVRIYETYPDTLTSTRISGFQTGNVAIGDGDLFRIDAYSSPFIGSFPTINKAIRVDKFGTIELNRNVIQISGNLGIGTTNPTSKLSVVGNVLVSGTVTATTFSGNFTGTATTSTSVIGGIGSLTQLQVTGISTFSNGPVFIGAATSTGTASQRLQVTGGAYVSGNLGIGTTNPLYTLSVVSSGASVTSGLTNVLADFTANNNSFSQINTRNASNGASASSDIIATADTGTDTTNYIDLGINNSGYSVGGWTINGALDGYLYTSDTNLSIGAASANKYVSIFTGGTLAANERLRVTGIGSVGIGTTNPTSTLHVVGDVRAGANSSQGVILTSPNGTKYRLIVSDLGVPSTVVVV